MRTIIIQKYKYQFMLAYISRRITIYVKVRALVSKPVFIE